MKRIVVLLMVLFGLFTVISGIVGALLHLSLPVAHIVTASIFAILCLIHMGFNRKAIAKYIKGK
jgi:uncharacterized membrane protein YfcA